MNALQHIQLNTRHQRRTRPTTHPRRSNQTQHSTKSVLVTIFIVLGLLLIWIGLTITHQLPVIYAALNVTYSVLLYVIEFLLLFGAWFIIIPPILFVLHGMAQQRRRSQRSRPIPPAMITEWWERWNSSPTKKGDALISSPGNPSSRGNSVQAKLVSSSMPSHRPTPLPPTQPWVKFQQSHKSLTILNERIIRLENEVISLQKRIIEPVQLQRYTSPLRDNWCKRKANALLLEALTSQYAKGQVDPTYFHRKRRQLTEQLS